MITIKYEKHEGSVYIANVDLLRVQMRTLRRAKIKVAFSNGYNPHMLIFMSAPTPNGINSVAEYVSVDTLESPESFIEKYNANCISSMKALSVYKTVKNPNTAGTVTHMQYRYEHKMPVENVRKIEELLSSDTLVISYKNKGDDETKEVRSLIYDYKITTDGMDFILSSGTQNLRVDRLIRNLTAAAHEEFYPIQITKTKQYKMQDGKLTDVDDILASLQII